MVSKLEGRLHVSHGKVSKTMGIREQKNPVGEVNGFPLGQNVDELGDAFDNDRLVFRQSGGTESPVPGLTSASMFFIVANTNERQDGVMETPSEPAW